MEVRETSLPGALLVVPRVHADERGFFAETFREHRMAEAGVSDVFVQENQSRSGRGVVRGLHFIIGPGAAKLVRCARGVIVDVIVDLRRGSPAFGRWEATELSDENQHSLYVPVGFGHGFCVMSDVADVVYKQSAYYAPELDRALAWNDPDVGVDWPLGPEEILVSERDARAPRLADIREDLPFTFGG